MNKKKAAPLFGIGGVILLTVLLVLCLTMFAVLALSSAQADLRLSEKNANAVSAYYKADTQAVKLMADAAALWQTGQERPNSEDVLTALSANYKLDVVELSVFEQEQELIFYCDIPVENGRVLRLELCLAPPAQPERWQVKQWQYMSPAPEWREEPPLPVWQG